ncbi:beta-arrestin-2-like isoform X2 [Uranotaenia lowii]|uniref:beta-arrestin-2-like isoform X2 n=1 Tax=Uranotaenia lowii TaxID=190385 RepID=UPI002478BBED|nr:beta-arrestin-2-like isoform X2 [Uranotaenia lowii]
MVDGKYRIADPSQRENLGIIVQYKVKVKLCITPLGGDLVAELPFILMHPKPDDDEPVIGDRSPGRTTNSAADGKLASGAGGSDLNRNSTYHGDAAKEDGPNLIQLDGDENCPDDDIIFEDFARLRLKGAETEA